MDRYTIVRPSVGFVSSAQVDSATYCKPGLPALTPNVNPDASAVTLSISWGTLPIACAWPAFQSPASDLPKLVAPSAAVSRWRAQNVDRATFLSKSSPAELLDAFSTQLESEGWQKFTAAANELLGSATYERTDASAKRLQAALTLYRPTSASDVYGAFVDVTDVAAPKLRQSRTP